MCAASAKFKELDKDESGFIEGQEGEEFCHWILDEVTRRRGGSNYGGHSHSDEDVEAESKMLMQEIDNDGSGQVCFDEFKAHWQKLEPQLERMRLAKERARERRARGESFGGRPRP